MSDRPCGPGGPVLSFGSVGFFSPKLTNIRYGVFESKGKSMDFDNPKVYGDTFVFDSLVYAGLRLASELFCKNSLVNRHIFKH